MATRRLSSAESGTTLTIVAFVAYLGWLIWTVVWKLDVPYIGAGAGLAKPIKLVPFLPSGDAGASAPLEVLANILLFVPLGLYLGLLAPRWRVWKVVVLSVAASLVLEISQHVLSTGSFDITDVIVNTAGGLAGLGLLALLRRRLQGRTASVLTRACVIGTAVLLLATVIFVASPLHDNRPRDVIIPLPSSSSPSS